MPKHNHESGTSGDGLKALTELVGNYNKMTDRAPMEKLVNVSIPEARS